jgi:hypothetical protein
MSAFGGKADIRRTCGLSLLELVPLSVESCCNELDFSFTLTFWAEAVQRRDFIAGLAGSAAAWPLTSRAQQIAMPVIGFLRPGSPELNAHLVTAFHKGMGETGYVEGRNVAVEYRWAQNDDRLAELAADLVRLRVAVIATPGSTVVTANQIRTY